MTIRVALAELNPWAIWLSWSPDLVHGGNPSRLSTPCLCGAIAEDDRPLKICWGAAESVMCVGAAKVADLVGQCLDRPRLAL